MVGEVNSDADKIYYDLKISGLIIDFVPDDVCILELNPKNDYLKNTFKDRWNSYNYQKKKLTLFNKIKKKKQFLVITELFQELQDLKTVVKSLTDKVDAIIIASNLPSTLTNYKIITTLKDEGFILEKWNREIIPKTDLFARFIKISPSNIMRNYYCSSCGACINVCPKNAIKFDLVENRLKPILDNKKCIDCNNCITVCPAINTKYKNNPSPTAYIYRSSDVENYHRSSSGGFVGDIAKIILEKNGIIYGSCWDEDHNVVFKSVNNFEDLKQIKRSKYLQSNTLFAYRSVKEDLMKDYWVLFTGTPCQVAALYNYLKKDYEKLITIDLICRYTPGLGHFKKFISDTFDIDSIKNISFRTEKANPKKVRVELSNNELYESNDPYYVAFDERLMSCDSCKYCKYANIPRQGDFTVGDFWGIEKINKKYSSYGSNIVLINSNKANEIIKKLKSFEYCDEIPEYLKTHNRFKGADISKPSYKYLEFNEILKTSKFCDAVSHIVRGSSDIGVVGIFVPNYGNNITYYALYKYLKNLKYTILMLPYPKSSVELIDNLFIKSPYLKSDIFIPNCKHDNLSKYNELCNTFILGSDQWLRPCFVKQYDWYQCLGWTSSNKKRISYATSFGVDVLDQDFKMLTKTGYLMSRFDSISVRETSGQRIFKDYFDLGSEVVLDPVFLLDPDEYKKMCRYGQSRMNSDKFIFSYIIDTSVISQQLLHKISESFNQNVYVITHPRYKNLKSQYESIKLIENAYIEEWLSMILHSDYVVTDSFHGLCFCLMFKKQFVVLKSINPRQFTRIQSLLSILNLTDRILDDGDDATILLQQKIDYNAVDRTLNNEIIKSKQWLNTAITSKKSNKYSIYDYYYAELKEIKSSIDKLEEHLDGNNSGDGD